MPNAKIVSMRATGSFVWKQGPAAGKTAYGQYIELSDGVRGGANAQSEQPNYKVGDEVEYTISGQDNRGQNKLKIKKADGQYAPSNQIPANAAQSVSNAAPVAQPNPHAQQMINGQTVGMAIGRACETLSDNFSTDQKLDGTFVKAVYELASQLVRISYKIEHGKLAEPLAVKQAQQQAAAVGFTPAVDDDSGPPF